MARAAPAARALLLTLALAAPLLPIAAAPARAQGSLQWYQHYERGLDAAARGEWEAALADFREAAQTRREPAARVRTYGTRFLFAYDPLYQQARCLAELGRLEESRELLAGAEAAGVTDPAELAALRQRLEALDAPRHDEEEAEPPADAVLAVRSTPIGARVRVDGRSVGTTPLPGLAVPPGRHRVELRLPGRDPWSGEVETRAGERFQLDVTLGPAVAEGEPGRPVRGGSGEAAAAPPETPADRPPVAAPREERGDESRTTETVAPPRTAVPLTPPPPSPVSSAAGEGTTDEPAPEPAAGAGETPAAAEPAGPPEIQRSPPARPPLSSRAVLLTGTGLVLVFSVLAGVAVRRRWRRSPVSVSTLPGRIGRYRVTGELGRGGMATTYRAVRVRDGLPVAIKIPHETGDPTYLPRFLREGRLGETLHHPRIVRIVEAGEEAGRPFLAMELIPGRTLRRALDEAGGAFPLRRALEVARDVAEAVDYAHGKGVVHRDLKPENVMLLPDGTVKVMDFGVARVEGQPGLTTSSFFFGSPVYAAPELVEPASIDHRADLYSLGVVLFELLQGRPPFHHESVFKLLEMHQKEPLPDPETLPHPLPDAVWAVLRRLLAKDPTDRYAGAQELLVDLERLLYELPGDTPGASEPARRSQSRQPSLGS